MYYLISCHGSSVSDKPKILIPKGVTLVLFTEIGLPLRDNLEKQLFFTNLMKTRCDKQTEECIRYKQYYRKRKGSVNRIKRRKMNSKCRPSPLQLLSEDKNIFERCKKNYKCPFCDKINKDFTQDNTHISIWDHQRCLDEDYFTDISLSFGPLISKHKTVNKFGIYPLPNDDLLQKKTHLNDLTSRVNVKGDTEIVTEEIIDKSYQGSIVFPNQVVDNYFKDIEHVRDLFIDSYDFSSKYYNNYLLSGNKIIGNIDNKNLSSEKIIWKPLYLSDFLPYLQPGVYFISVCRGYNLEYQFLDPRNELYYRLHYGNLENRIIENTLPDVSSLYSIIGYYRPVNWSFGKIMNYTRDNNSIVKFYYKTKDSNSTYSKDSNSTYSKDSNSTYSKDSNSTYSKEINLSLYNYVFLSGPSSIITLNPFDCTNNNKYFIGDKVYSKFNQNSLDYPATIIRQNKDSTYLLRFNHGKTKDGVSSEQIKCKNIDNALLFTDRFVRRIPYPLINLNLELNQVSTTLIYLKNKLHYGTWTICEVNQYLPYSYNRMAGDIVKVIKNKDNYISHISKDKIVSARLLSNNVYTDKYYGNRKIREGDIVLNETKKFSINPSKCNRNDSLYNLLSYFISLVINPNVNYHLFYTIFNTLLVLFNHFDIKSESNLFQSDFDPFITLLFKINDTFLDNYRVLESEPNIETDIELMDLLKQILDKLIDYYQVQNTELETEIDLTQSGFIYENEYKNKHFNIGETLLISLDPIGLQKKIKNKLKIDKLVYYTYDYLKDEFTWREYLIDHLTNDTYTFHHPKSENKIIVNFDYTIDRLRIYYKLGEVTDNHPLTRSQINYMNATFYYRNGLHNISDKNIVYKNLLSHKLILGTITRPGFIKVIETGIEIDISEWEEKVFSYVTLSDNIYFFLRLPYQNITQQVFLRPPYNKTPYKYSLQLEKYDFTQISYVIDPIFLYITFYHHFKDPYEINKPFKLNLLNEMFFYGNEIELKTSSRRIQLARQVSAKHKKLYLERQISDEGIIDYD